MPAARVEISAAGDRQPAHRGPGGRPPPGSTTAIASPTLLPSRRDCKGGRRRAEGQGGEWGLGARGWGLEKPPDCVRGEWRRGTGMPAQNTLYIRALIIILIYLPTVRVLPVCPLTDESTRHRGGAYPAFLGGKSPANHPAYLISIFTVLSLSTWTLVFFFGLEQGENCHVATELETHIGGGRGCAGVDHRLPVVCLLWMGVRL